ncbi:hypothetical protein HZH68_003740 [Vespula germanica]|uniref:Uncharacterized protein n=1 Tax=Vespula germanica TaxID=30212 RepID=A0A834NPN1_VESGE|nr:hypothetical protein HZH68_003740 [Vespula germanica]
MNSDDPTAARCQDIWISRHGRLPQCHILRESAVVGAPAPVHIELELGVLVAKLSRLFVDAAAATAAARRSPCPRRYCDTETERAREREGRSFRN